MAVSNFGDDYSIKIIIHLITSNKHPHLRDILWFAGSRKLPPSPNSDANPKPNPDTDRGQFSRHRIRLISGVSIPQMHTEN